MNDLGDTFLKLTSPHPQASFKILLNCVTQLWLFSWTSTIKYYSRVISAYIRLRTDRATLLSLALFDLHDKMN